MLIQLFVAAFSSFLVVGLATLYDPGAASGGEVVVGVTGDAADDLERAGEERAGVETRRYDARSDALAAFREGNLDAVAVATHREGRIAVAVTAPGSSLRKTLVIVQLRETLETLERQKRTERASHIDAALPPLPPRVDASTYFGFAYTVLIPLLLFLPTFIAGSTAVDGITSEIERGTLDLLRVTPASTTEVVEGKGLAMGVLAPAQAALWLLLLEVNGIGVADPAALLALVTGLTLVVVGSGALLALLVPNRQRAQLLYSLGVLAGFAVAALLPQHPATTVARLAVGSVDLATYAHVAGYIVVGVAAALAIRIGTRRLDPETL